MPPPPPPRAFPSGVLYQILGCLRSCFLGREGGENTPNGGFPFPPVLLVRAGGSSKCVRHKLEIEKTSCPSGHHASWQNPALPAVTHATAQKRKPQSINLSTCICQLQHWPPPTPPRRCRPVSLFPWPVPHSLQQRASHVPATGWPGGGH